MSYHPIRKVALPTLGVFLGAFSLSSDSWAGSTAAQTTPGYLSVDPAVCGSGPSPCFVQYGSVVPISGSFSASVSVTNPTIGAAVPATANYVAGNKGGLLVGITLDGSSNVNVNCVVGCSGGTSSNASDAVATSSTNGQTIAWLYGYNGATFDRLRTALNGLNSVGTGLLTDQPAAQCDDTSPTAITENSFGNVRLGCADHSFLVAGSKAGVATALSLDGSGYLNVDVAAGSVSLTGTSPVNLTQVGGSSVSLGSKTAANSIPVVLASDYGTAQEATTSGSLGSPVMGAVTTADPSYTTAKLDYLSLTTTGHLRDDLASIAGTATATGNGTSSAGALRVAIVSDQTTLTNTIGNVGEVPITSGGLSSSVIEPTASDNHANIKNGAGQVYGIHYFNKSATINYIRLYNAASGFNGCNSATNLAWEGHIPGNSTNDAGAVIPIPEGLAFSTGISICVTGAYGQTDTTNATASSISVNVLYK